MTQKQMLRLAAKVNEKDWSFDQLKYCDDLYGHEDDADSVWEFVIESDKIGSDGMKEKYADWPR